MHPRVDCVLVHVWFPLGCLGVERRSGLSRSLACHAPRSGDRRRISQGKASLGSTSYIINASRGGTYASGDGQRICTRLDGACSQKICGYGEVSSLLRPRLRSYLSPRVVEPLTAPFLVNNFRGENFLVVEVKLLPLGENAPVKLNKVALA